MRRFSSRVSRVRTQPHPKASRRQRQLVPPPTPPPFLFLVPDLPPEPPANENLPGVEWTEVQRSIVERAVETVGDASTGAAIVVFLLILELQRTNDAGTEHGAKLLGALHRLLDAHITRHNALDVMKKIHEIGDRLRLNGSSEIDHWTTVARFVVQKVYAQGYTSATENEPRIPRSFTSRSHHH